MKKEEITKFLNTILKWSILCTISDNNSKKDFKDLGVMIMMFMMAHNIEIEDINIDIKSLNKFSSLSLFKP